MQITAWIEDAGANLNHLGCQWHIGSDHNAAGHYLPSNTLVSDIKA